jgi:hypothetical protein
VAKSKVRPVRFVGVEGDRDAEALFQRKDRLDLAQAVQPERIRCPASRRDVGRGDSRSCVARIAITSASISVVVVIALP